MAHLAQQVIRQFEKAFGDQPAWIARAPGRVNLIGEHTDYNDGFVLPMAIDRAVWVALRPRTDSTVKLFSADYNQLVQFNLNQFENESNGWSEYVKGVAWALQQTGARLKGWAGAIMGDVPRGAGLSSSAALEMATARAFAAVSGIDWDAPLMAKVGQRAENKWVGVNCGIMDQMISAAGVPGHALLIDCRSLQTTAAPLPPHTVIVILDTATRRGLVGSAYNERRTQCETAAHFFGVPALRDVTPEMFAARPNGLPELPLRRASHIISENERTLQAAQVMARGDAVELGKLFIASHISMRDDFEISCRELDCMVECALQQPDCFGARMTGGGFGGCAVALVKEDAAQKFVENTSACYFKATGLQPGAYIAIPTGGASIEQVIR